MQTFLWEVGKNNLKVLIASQAEVEWFGFIFLLKVTKMGYGLKDGHTHTLRLYQITDNSD